MFAQKNDQNFNIWQYIWLKYETIVKDEKNKEFKGLSGDCLIYNIVLHFRP